VTLIDISAPALEKGLAAIRKNLEREVKRRRSAPTTPPQRWPASRPPAA
jgi:3-hydroxyacyl-CoA dehydrogenase